MLTLPEDKVIITMAATGAMSAKTMNPAVPEQPEEIARSVYEASMEEMLASCTVGDWLRRMGVDSRGLSGLERVNDL
jgi:hypothetical protein